jgi:ribosomal protein S27E
MCTIPPALNVARPARIICPGCMHTLSVSFPSTYPVACQVCLNAHHSQGRTITCLGCMHTLSSVPFPSTYPVACEVCLNTCLLRARTDHLSGLYAHTELRAIPADVSTGLRGLLKCSPSARPTRITCLGCMHTVS